VTVSDHLFSIRSYFLFCVVDFILTECTYSNDILLCFQDNEYVLVQLQSTPHITYCDVHDTKHTDDFDATLIVAHDGDNASDHSNLHIKYYIILTSRR